MAARSAMTTIHYDAAGKVEGIQHALVHEVQADFGKGLETARKAENQDLRSGEISAATIAAVAALVAAIESDIAAL